MAKAEKNTPIKIVSGVPAMSVDGHGIAINPDGNVQIVFFQIIAQNIQPTNAATGDNKELEGSVVAAVRLNVEQLQKFNNDIIESIKKYNKESAKPKNGKSNLK